MCGLLTISIIILPDSPWSPSHTNYDSSFTFYMQLPKPVHSISANLSKWSAHSFDTLVSALVEFCLDHRDLLIGFFASTSFFSFYLLNCHHSFTLKQVLSYYSSNLHCSPFPTPTCYNPSAWFWKFSKNVILSQIH